MICGRGPVVPGLGGPGWPCAAGRAPDGAGWVSGAVASLRFDPSTPPGDAAL